MILLILFSWLAMILAVIALVGTILRQRRQAVRDSARAKWEAFDQRRAGLDRTQMLTLKQLGLVLLFGISLHFHWSLRRHHRHTVKIDRPLIQEMRR